MCSKKQDKLFEYVIFIAFALAFAVPMYAIMSIFN